MSWHSFFPSCLTFLANAPPSNCKYIHICPQPQNIGATGTIYQDASWSNILNVTISIHRNNLAPYLVLEGDPGSDFTWTPFLALLVATYRTGWMRTSCGSCKGLGLLNGLWGLLLNNLGYIVQQAKAIRCMACAGGGGKVYTGGG